MSESVDYHQDCLTECADGCVLRRVRDALGETALTVDEEEPVGGLMAEKLVEVYFAMTRVCLEQSTGDQKLSRLDNQIDK